VYLLPRGEPKPEAPSSHRVPFSAVLAVRGFSRDYRRTRMRTSRVRIAVAILSKKEDEDSALRPFIAGVT
ncbi:Hypothetical predicted protein, partial [Pelobates cultripes]